MIKPTVGRVVWYYPSAEEMTHGLPMVGTELAAIIAHVYDDTIVNLMVIDSNGNPHSRQSVHLDQHDQRDDAGAYCRWMPYQKGQAAKTEQLERALDAGASFAA